MSRPVIKSGRILTYRLYDVAYEIDLAGVEHKLAVETKRIRIERRPFSKAFEFANPPVSFLYKRDEKELDGTRYPASVFCKAYDFGVLSIIFEIPVSYLEFPALERLALVLENDSGMDLRCREYLNQIISILGDSIKGFNISRFEEDYSIFFVETMDPGMTADEFFEDFNISRLMLYEEKDLSARTRNELMSSRLSYYTNDAVVLNFDNAFIIEPSGSSEIPDILEFANAQMLELRYYDHIVDRELDFINKVTTRRSFPFWSIKKYEVLAAKVMKTVTELTDTTEKIDNSLKVTEDVYYAKIYISALKLFRVKEWEDGIRRKLDLASRAYDMLYREIATKRAELLELTIVLLIIVEIVIYFYIK